MPFRSDTRYQDWLFPPSLGDFLPEDHPVRFVREFVASLDLDSLGINTWPEQFGAPAYRLDMLLACWLYAFMMGVRSSRKLELACREQIPFKWLMGNQEPDHVTLWRFYRDNRGAMRALFQETVRVAVELEAVGLVLQALDGTRIASASGASLKDENQLRKLQEAVDREIAELESRNQDDTGGHDGRVRAKKEERQARIAAALDRLQRENAQKEGKGQNKRKVSISDPEAQQMPGGRHWVVGYNGQVVVDAKEQIIVAADLDAESTDTRQLRPMLEQVKEQMGRMATTTLADAGYYSTPNLAFAEGKTELLIATPSMSDVGADPQKQPFHRDNFDYDEERDEFTCPEGRKLPHFYTRDTKTATASYQVEVYLCQSCEGCPSRDECTSSKRGRQITISEFDHLRRRTHERMGTEEAREQYNQRAPLAEGVFGNMKEAMNVRRFLCRGIENARASWLLLCSAFNLRKLHRIWATALT